MKRFLVFILLALLVTPFLLIANPVLAAPRKIALIGSSSFAGFCNLNLDQELKKNLGDASVTCLAKSGTAANYFLEQYESNVKGKGFTDIVVYGGLNGLNSASGLKSGQSNLTSLFKQAEAEGTRVIVVGAQPFAGYQTWTPEWGGNLKANNQWLATKPNGVDVYIDLYSAFDQDGDDTQDPQYRGSDFLHVNKSGQLLLLQLLLKNGFDTASVLPAGTNQTQPSQNYIPKTEDEVDKLISEPVLRIKIPGVNLDTIKFSDPSISDFSLSDDSVYLSVPFIGEYLAAVYRYAVIVISILAVVFLIVAGFMWAIPDSSGENISKAKTMIQNSIVGLIICVASYTILFTINPNLVQFRALDIRYIPGEESFVFENEEPLYQESETSGPVTASADLKNPTYDSLFEKYGACLPVDWRFLKVIAYAESRYNAGVTNKYGFTGLFQTKTKFCQGTLKKYGLSGVCNNLTNPEVSTMVGTSMLKHNLKTIRGYCPQASAESIAYFTYVGHQSGAGALVGALKQTCDHTKGYEALHYFWNNYKNGKYADSTGGKRTAKHIAAEGDRGGKNTVKRLQSLGVSVGFKNEIPSACPLNTPGLRGI